VHSFICFVNFLDIVVSVY